jgi:hypothetical protein
MHLVFPAAADFDHSSVSLRVTLLLMPPLPPSKSQQRTITCCGCSSGCSSGCGGCGCGYMGSEGTNLASCSGITHVETVGSGNDRRWYMTQMVLAITHERSSCPSNSVFRL